MVFVTLPNEKGHGHAEGEKLCNGDGTPDPADFQKEGQKQYTTDLEDQRPQERDGCGEQTIVERREESRPVNIETVDQIGDAVDPETKTGQFKKCCVVADKKPGERGSNELCHRKEKNAPGADQRKAFAEKILEFSVVAGSIVEADDRSTSNRISQKNSDKNKVYIHDGSVGGDSVFSGIFHQLKIVKGVDDGA